MSITMIGRDPIEYIAVCDRCNKRNFIQSLSSSALKLRLKNSWLFVGKSAYCPLCLMHVLNRNVLIHG
jgi:hypothetical protein